MTQAQDMIDTAASALNMPEAQVKDAWQSRVPSTHRLHHRDVLVFSTPGARKHADEATILSMARRFYNQDWGEMDYPEDMEQNRRNVRRDRGILFGVYSAPDGETLWIQQDHRFVPATLMLPAER